jgi:hypothetical protein
MANAADCEHVLGLINSGKSPMGRESRSKYILLLRNILQL